MKTLWNAEPVAIAAAVRAVLVAAVALGLDLTAEQIVALVAAVESLTALVVRRTVTSPATRAEIEGGD